MNDLREENKPIKIFAWQTFGIGPWRRERCLRGSASRKFAGDLTDFQAVISAINSIQNFRQNCKLEQGHTFMAELKERRERDLVLTTEFILDNLGGSHQSLRDFRECSICNALGLASFFHKEGTEPPKLF